MAETISFGVGYALRRKADGLWYRKKHDWRKKPYIHNSKHVATTGRTIDILLRYGDTFPRLPVDTAIPFSECLCAIRPPMGLIPRSLVEAHFDEYEVFDVQFSGKPVSN